MTSGGGETREIEIHANDTAKFWMRHNGSDFIRFYQDTMDVYKYARFNGGTNISAGGTPTLQDVTDAENSSDNRMFITGQNNSFSSGAGLLLQYDPTDKRGVVNSYEYGTGRTSLLLQGSPINLEKGNVNITDGNLSVDGTGTSTFAGDIELFRSIYSNNSQDFNLYAGRDFHIYLNRENASTQREFGIYDKDNNNILYAESNTRNVGIGTTSPSEKLEVNGNVRAGSYIFQSGDRSSYRTNFDLPMLYSTEGTGSEYPFNSWNHLVLQSRSSQNRDILFVTGSSPAERMAVTESDVKFWEPLQIYNNNIRINDRRGVQHHFGYSSQDTNSGMILWTQTNPADGEPIFRVLSSGMAERLRVEHNGVTSVDNDFSATGNITADGDMTADNFILSSDRRLKHNIQPIHDALTKALFLNPVQFNHNEDNRADIGFIAQNVQKMFPELVHERKDGYLSLSYDQFTAINNAAIHELYSEFQSLKKENQKLRNEVEKLKSKMNEICKQLED
jgi:hypothetical protein